MSDGRRPSLGSVRLAGRAMLSAGAALFVSALFSHVTGVDAELVNTHVNATIVLMALAFALVAAAAACWYEGYSRERVPRQDEKPGRYYPPDVRR